MLRLIRWPAWLDWQLVRGIAELAILGRASMALLVFVPILASLWPVVDRLVTQAGGTQTPLTPSWALLFIASLASLGGRVTFQTWCPQTVQNVSLIDYRLSKKREYAGSPSHVALEDAKERLVAGYGLKDTNGGWITNAGRLETQAIQALHALEQTTEQGRLLREMNIVELAARPAYIHEARKDRFACLVCALLYAVACMLILFVLAHQTMNVVCAAELLGKCLPR